MADLRLMRLRTADVAANVCIRDGRWGGSRPNADEGSATVNALRCSGNAFVALAEAHASGIHFVL